MSSLEQAPFPDDNFLGFTWQAQNSIEQDPRFSGSEASSQNERLAAWKIPMSPGISQIIFAGLYAEQPIANEHCPAVTMLALPNMLAFLDGHEFYGTMAALILTAAAGVLLLDDESTLLLILASAAPLLTVHLPNWSRWLSWAAMKEYWRQSHPLSDYYTYFPLWVRPLTIFVLAASILRITIQYMKAGTQNNPQSSREDSQVPWSLIHDCGVSRKYTHHCLTRGQ